MSAHYWSKIGRARTGPRADALSTQNLTEFEVKPVYPISEVWFEGRFLILCSAAGHSVWEMIDSNCSIFLCPAEQFHKIAHRKASIMTSLVWYYCDLCVLIYALATNQRCLFRPRNHSPDKITRLALGSLFRHLDFFILFDWYRAMPMQISNFCETTRFQDNTFEACVFTQCVFPAMRAHFHQ